MKPGVKVFLFGFLFLTSAISPASAQDGVSWIQKIKSFFTGNSVAEQTQPADEQEKKQETSVPEKKKPVFDFSEKTIGNREAPLKINVFTSLTCPHCTNAHTQLLPYLKEKYVSTNEAIIILNDFPIEPRAVTASLISRCLTGDAYYAFIETLFENQRSWAAANDVQEALLPYAKLAGLSEDDMIACATDSSAMKEIVRQRNLAIMRHNIHATPTFILQLGGEKEVFEGAPSRSDIDERIEKLKKSYTGPWPAPESEKKPSEPSAP